MKTLAEKDHNQRPEANRDALSQQRLQALFEEQAIRYKTLLETSMDSIYVMDEKGDLQEANAAFLRRRGYTAADVKGLNVADWEAQWSREELQERMRKLVDSSAVFETRHRCKDGSIFDVEVCATSVRIGGKPLFFVVTRDITERKQAEQALRETDTRFRQLAENISTVFWLSNAEGMLIHYISPAYEKIWGRSCDSLYAEPASWMDSIHPDDRERIVEEERLQLVTGQHDHTYRIIRPDGSIRWVRDRAFPVRDESGKLIRVAGIAEDITEREEAEELVLRAREFYLTLLDKFPTPVRRSDVNGGSNYFNQTWLEFTGRTKAQELGEGWTEGIHPGDLARCLKTYREALDLRRPVEVEYRLRRNDGEYRWVLDHGRPFENLDGQFAGYIGSCYDFTERKLAEDALRKSEARFRGLLTSNITGVVFWTLQGDILDANDLFLNMVDYARDDLRQGNLNWKNITPPEYAPVDEKAIGELLATGTCAPFEKEYIRKDGGRVSVLIGSALFEDQKDAGSSFVMDITERKKAEEQLQHYTHLLETLSRRLFEVQEKERRHLARELHDEIGQALTAAKLNLQSAIGHADAATLARLQETDAILDQLLVQIRQISVDLRPSMLDDLGLVPALRSLLDQQGRRALLAVRLSSENIPEQLDPEIQTTCYRIAQEAITNAIRHAHAKKIDVDLRCENDKLRLVIRDNGIGFDVESVRAQTDGLGLIGIKERAGLLGGRARIISSSSKGTTIEVSLPLRSRGKRARRGLA